MIHAQGLEQKFWGEAVITATYLKNRSPTRSTQDNKTPFEVWNGRKLSLGHLQVFRTTAYTFILKEKRTKFEPKTLKIVFVRYCENSKVYWLYDPLSRKIIKSRDVHFPNQDTMKDLSGEPVEELISNKDNAEPVGESILIPLNEDTPGEPQQEDLIPENNEEILIEPLRRSTRDRRPPRPYWITDGNNDAEANIAYLEEPQTYQEAVNGDKAAEWKDAMKLELESIKKNETWTLTTLPPGRKAIGSKWVYRLKYNVDGKIKRYKARIVAKGYSQKEGIDYTETFAPVTKFPAIRLLLAIAAKEDFEVHQMDVQSAFLNRDLDEEIYMNQPEGFIEEGQEDLVCRLKKSLYGLKQASRTWYKKLYDCLVGFSFTQCNADYIIYYYQEGSTKVIISAYVDDLIIMSNNLPYLQETKKKLGDIFTMRDLGEISSYLGIEIKRDRKNRTVSLSQSKYIEDILKKYRMENCRPISTPMDMNKKLSKVMCPKIPEEIEEMKNIPYQSAVGSLIYLMLGTRPDIAFAVGALSQFNSNYGKEHWQAVKRIFRYLQATKYMQLTYTFSTRLFGYTDANWGGNLDNRRSTGRFVFIFAGRAISWSSKLQETVALSSTESEYMAATQASREVIWFGKLLQEIGYSQDRGITIILADNQRSINLAKNPTQHARMKHIDIQHYFIREKVKEKKIELVYCSTDDIVANMLTKSVTRDKLQRFSKQMGLRLCIQSGSVET